MMRRATMKDFLGDDGGTSSTETGKKYKSDTCAKDTDYKRQINVEFGAKKFIKP